MQIPDFIENSHPKTYEVLDHYLRTEPQADFASGYFNLGGYGLLREALAKVPVLRLLLSKEPGSMADGEPYPAGFRADLAGAEFSARNTELARELIDLLREEKVEVRLFTEGFFHAKAYVFDNVSVVGSSNFTAVGLTSNSELNSVHKQGYAANELREWFEGFWTRSEDYKEGLIRLLEESKFDSREYSPYEVSMKSLYEYYREEIELDEAEKQPPGSSLVPLANFQELAYKKGLQILDRYDGLLVADSVGLGKTWIGKKLLEHYGYFMRQNCLVVCPAQLRQMWEEELASATIPHRVVTMEKLGQRDTLVFTTFKDTAEYLEEAFRDNPGLGERRLEVLHGGVAPETRANVIQRFAPLASGHPEISGRGDEIDVLITTDVLSEGQNLQDADSVVNYDLHWNPTKMVQRTGRIDRLGSPHEEITVHNFFPDEGLDELLGLMERLAARIEDEDQSVTAELEAETEVSGEVLRQILADYLKEFGTERLERIPYGCTGLLLRQPGLLLPFPGARQAPLAPL